jgi:hypothetical protein
MTQEMRNEVSAAAEHRERLRSALARAFVRNSCNFVDRVLRIGSHTIHEITLSYIKEHEIESRVLHTLMRYTPPKEAGLTNDIDLRNRLSYH